MVFLGLKLQENRKKTGRKPEENQKKTKRKPKENQKKTEENRRKPEEKKTTAPPSIFFSPLLASIPPAPLSNFFQQVHRRDLVSRSVVLYCRDDLLPPEVRVTLYFGVVLRHLKITDRHFVLIHNQQRSIFVQIKLR